MRAALLRALAALLAILAAFAAGWTLGRRPRALAPLLEAPAPAQDLPSGARLLERRHATAAERGRIDAIRPGGVPVRAVALTVEPLEPLRPLELRLVEYAEPDGSARIAVASDGGRILESAQLSLPRPAAPRPAAWGASLLGTWEDGRFRPGAALVRTWGPVRFEAGAFTNRQVFLGISFTIR